MLADSDVKGVAVSCPNDRFGCADGTTPLSLNIAEGLSLLSLRASRLTHLEY